MDVFVINHSEDDAQLPTGLCGDLGGKVLPSSGIVACIADNEWGGAQGLPASGKSGEF